MTVPVKLQFYNSIDVLKKIYKYNTDHYIFYMTFGTNYSSVRFPTAGSLVHFTSTINCVKMVNLICVSFFSKLACFNK